jgi:hypothetical protein
VVPYRRRNRLRRLFDDSHPAALDKLQLARGCVADLRASGRYPDDPAVRGLVDELSADSPRFAELWAAHEIRIQRSMTKRTVHPIVGELDLDLEILNVPGCDLRLVLHTAAPGTTSHHALQLLHASR